MCLEDRVCCGGVFYLHSIEPDPDNKRLILRFLGDPEEDPVVRILSFTRVEDYVEHWDEERDPALIEQLIGIAERSQDGYTRYVLRLDQYEIHLSSDAEPQVQDL